MKSKNRNIIFIGGIHGVGKGTICRSVSKKVNMQHISASKVLKWDEISAKENKKVENLDNTQLRLLSGLNALIKEEFTYLLDGHYCLLNSEGEPEEISEQTFELISPKKLVVIVENSKEINDRLNDRDGVDYNLNTIENMQNMELKYAKYLSIKLDIPFLKINSQEEDQLIKFINK